MTATRDNDDVIGTAQGDLREAAVRRLKKRRDFAAHLFTYIVINGLVWAIWALTGEGYPWPLWLTGLWGIGLIFNAWDVYVRRPITEDEIRHEVERLSHRS
jgi:2TM domain